jgi:hypothetical protein
MTRATSGILCLTMFPSNENNGYGYVDNKRHAK